MRRPKDRDFVETKEGFFFCLVGYLHPPDRYTAYLKYTPADTGPWSRGEIFYHRELPYYHVRNVLKTVEVLEQYHPEYVWFDPVRSLKFSFVPKEAVAHYYLPEERLTEILRTPADPLEDAVQRLVELLTTVGGLPPEAFGITGSILLKVHNPAFSDIDLLVYGRENAQKVKGAVEALKGGPIQELEPQRRAQWRTETAGRFALGPEDVAYLGRRRWNYFLFQGRYVSVHPTRLDAEILERYGDHRYKRVGPATVEATVTDAAESLFLPAIYRLADVKFIDGGPFRVQELVSFEALYCQIADPGDPILARGQVEEEESGSCRLVVGSAALHDGGLIRVHRSRTVSRRDRKAPL